MALYVRDNSVHELAARLAKRRNCTVTDAVRAALQEALVREESEREERRRRAREILAKFDSAPRLRDRYDDSVFYDENGLPIL